MKEPEKFWYLLRNLSFTLFDHKEIPGLFQDFSKISEKFQDFPELSRTDGNYVIVIILTI